MLTGLPLPYAIDEMLFPARLTTCPTEMQNQLCDHAGIVIVSMPKPGAQEPPSSRTVRSHLETGTS